jgi:hypothetical protein
MSLVFLAVVGFAFLPQSGANCVEVLHQLRTEHQMEVTAAETVGSTLVYLLANESHNKKTPEKTAQIGCRLDLVQP